MTELSTSVFESSTSTPAVVLDSVSKLFGRFAALHDLTAIFDSGKLYALLGENGAGKTTFLRIVAGLAKPTRGRVQVLSRDPQNVSGRIGYMAHATLLYDELTARENLEYFRELYPERPKESVEALLEQVNLARVDPKRRVSAYSQGMKQRLALARALVARPDLLLLDEPFSNVDSKSIATMSSLLAGLREAGATVIVITHQIEALAGIADEWITMRAGTIVQRQHSIPNAPVMALHGGER